MEPQSRLGHPEVGAAGVEDHLELLRRRADGDVGEVLCIQEVADGDWVVLLGLNGVFALVAAEELFEMSLWPNAHVLLPEGLHVLVDVGILELL